MRICQPWSEEDLAKLKELARTNMPWAEVAKELNRSANACAHCAKYHEFVDGLPPRKNFGGHLNRWSPEDDAYLLANYDYAKREKIAKKLGRSVYAICVRWSQIARGKRRTHAHWTREEEMLLRSLWPDTKRSVIKRKLKPRTWAGIQCHARDLGIVDQRFQGYELFQHTAKRLGISHTGLKSLLTNMGVKARRDSRYLYIEIEAIDAALIEWDRRETIVAGAARLRINPATLTTLLKKAGVHPGYRKTTRYPPELLDRLAARYRKEAAHVQPIRDQ